MTDLKKQQDLQQRYMKLQMLEQQMQQVQKQLQTFDIQLQDLAVTKQSLEDLKKTEIGTEILSTLSPGIFIKTKLAENKDVTINVGSNVAVKKEVAGAQKLVDEQITEIQKLQMQLTRDLQQLSTIALQLEKEMHGSL